VASLRRKLEENWRAEAEAQNLSKARPATLAGAAAMIQHVLEFVYEDEPLEDWSRAALTRVADALNGMHSAPIAPAHAARL
jgi:hypothetical protein